MAERWTVTLVDASNAGLVPDLIYRVYGYSYTDGWMYDARAIIEVIAREGHRFWLTLDARGDAVCMVALRYPYGQKCVAEFGTFISDPARDPITRGLALGTMMDVCGKYVADRLLRRELSAVISTESTAHVLSQRVAQRLGFKTVGLYLGWVPSWGERLRDRRLASPTRTSPVEPGALFRARRSETVSALVPPELVTPYATQVPPAVAPFLEQAYARLALPATPVPPEQPSGPTRLGFVLDHLRQRAVIEVETVGADAAAAVLERFDHCRAGLCHLIHVRLPLGRADTTPVINELMKRGAVYAALIPRHGETDMLVLQHLDYDAFDLGVERVEDTLAQAIVEASTPGRRARASGLR